VIALEEVFIILIIR